MKKIKKTIKKSVLKRQIHQIDATGKILGRLACQVTILLQGKNKPSFQYHLDGGENVVVTNAAKMKFTGKKLRQKKYYHYSGYPSGLKEKRMAEVFAKNPAEVLKRAIWNMLPKNKLRAKIIKRLKINN